MNSQHKCARFPLGDLLLGIETGKSMRSTERIARPDELGVLKVSALSWGEFNPTEAKAVEQDYKPEEHHRVFQGDVLISRCNTVELVGAVVRVDRDYPNRLLSDKTLRLVLDDKRCDPDYIVQVLRLPEARAHIEENATGTSNSMRNISQDTIRATAIPLPCLEVQKEIASNFKKFFDPVDKARRGLAKQHHDLTVLPTALINRSLASGTSSIVKLGTVLTEVTRGIGSKWRTSRVLGATRAGLAPARERPGKTAERYKPVTAGTVFYNPMRILIGSVAFVDDDDEPGITSPDYVVLKGKPDVVDSRWFYYWLRSSWGERFIQSLARGAVRERMLFNRLAEGEIELPDYASQVKASRALAQIKPIQAAIQKQLEELESLPNKLLAKLFLGN